MRALCRKELLVSNSLCLLSAALIPVDNWDKALGRLAKRVTRKCSGLIASMIKWLWDKTLEEPYLR